VTAQHLSLVGNQINMHHPARRQLLVARLLNSVCALAVAGYISAPAMAADSKIGPQQKNPAVKFMPGADSASVSFEADQLSYDAELGIVRAIGRVFLTRDGYTLQAGEVTYNEKTGTAEARGAVELTLPSGEKLFAPQLALTDALKNAFINDFRLLLTDGSKAAAQSGEHNDAEGKTTLNRAIYSPCQICEGNDRPPAWQIKAVKVVHDRKKRRLYYRGATLEILGVPIVYTPYLSHPDPTVDRASGFLPVDIRSRRELGVVVGLPYYFVLGDSSDLTLKPILTTRENAVLAAEYRQHLGWGQYEAEGSITYSDERDEFNRRTGSQELRGHIKTSGVLNHAHGWRSTFDVNYASDDTYLRRYNFSNEDTLVSDYRLERFFDASYISARSLAFQGLRAEDRAGLTPFAVPLLEAEYVTPLKPLGGSITMGGNALALTRTDGLDTQRISAYANWRRRIVGPTGILMDFDAFVRGDLYNVRDGDRPDDPSFGAQNGTTERGIARLSTRISWPLVKFTSTGAHTLEPLVDITLQPNAGQPAGLVNEDGRAFELSDINILSSERTAGYDLIEEGIRASYGLKWSYAGADLNASVFLGQVVRLSGDLNQFTEGLGLEGRTSDIVGRTRISYKNWLQLDHHYRLDDGNLAARRNEAYLTIGPQDAFAIQFGYFKLDRDLNFINREDREELRINANWNVDNNWRLFGGIVEDLTNGTDTIEFNAGAGYSDECIGISLRVRRTYFQDRDIRPGVDVQFQLSLKNLG